MDRKLDRAAVFLPMNLPLYSLALYAIAPSFMFENVAIRISSVLEETLQILIKILDLNVFLPNLFFPSVNRSTFVEGFASVSNVIIFTGNYENAEILNNKLFVDLFIYNGYGVNPIIVDRGCNIELATNKVLRARTFNSGQDCDAPDIIFVSGEVEDSFTKSLINKLKVIGVGDYSSSNNVIGKLLSEAPIVNAEEIIADRRNNIVYGGNIDKTLKIVFPTVIKTNIDQSEDPQELFCPIFYISVYKNLEQVKNLLSTDRYADFAMYLSYFGAKKNIKFKNTITLYDKIFEDVDDGCKPFGGFGPKANFVSINGKKHIRPILVNKEIVDYINMLNK
ncbi:MAG: aldehyde dehydrogenase family protein [Bacteroidales bacterium]|nr:aldehyde dehydrogenase family protein [Bacteroidales bacterium]